MVVIVVVNCHVDLSCGRRAYTHYSSRFRSQHPFCHHPSSNFLSKVQLPPLNLALCPKGLAGVVSIKGSCTTSAIDRHPTERNHREVEAAIMLRQRIQVMVPRDELKPPKKKKSHVKITRILKTVRRALHGDVRSVKRRVGTCASAPWPTTDIVATK